MKKLLIAACTALVCMTILIFTVSALNATVTPDKTEAEAGDTVIFTVTLDESVAVKSGALELIFDDTALSLTKTAWKGDVSDNSMLKTFDKSTMKGAFAFDDAYDVSGNIFTATFTVLDTANGGNTDVSAVVVLKDADDAEIPLENITGTLKINKTCTEHVFTSYVPNGDGTSTATCDFCDATDVKTEAEAQTAAEKALPTLFSFDGYQVRLYSYAGLRARFTCALGEALDGVSLVESGTIIAAAENGRTMADLTVSKSGDAYVPSGNKILSVKASESNLFSAEDESKHFACALTFQSETELTKAALTTEVLFRGYAVLSVYGFEIVLYADMTSDTFGDTVSMYELSSCDAFKDHETSKKVLEICEQTSEEDSDVEIDFGDLLVK